MVGAGGTRRSLSAAVGGPEGPRRGFRLARPGVIARPTAGRARRPRRDLTGTGRPGSSPRLPPAAVLTLGVPPAPSTGGPHSHHPGDPRTQPGHLDRNPHPERATSHRAPPDGHRPTRPGHRTPDVSGTRLVLLADRPGSPVGVCRARGSTVPRRRACQSGFGEAHAVVVTVASPTKPPPGAGTSSSSTAPHRVRGLHPGWRPTPADHPATVREPNLLQLLEPGAHLTRIDRQGNERLRPLRTNRGGARRGPNPNHALSRRRPGSPPPALLRSRPPARPLPTPDA